VLDRIHKNITANTGRTKIADLTRSSLLVDGKLKSAHMMHYRLLQETFVRHSFMPRLPLADVLHRSTVIVSR
jgi:hypothetical protein